MDEASEILRLASRMDAPDPIVGNPLRTNDVRHEFWATATALAEEKVCLLRAGFLQSKPISLEAAISARLQLMTRQYDVWSQRGLSVVLERAAIQDYEQWLANYAAATLKTWSEAIPNDPVPIGFTEVMQHALLARREHWKAEARRFVAQQEQFEDRCARAINANQIPVWEELFARFLKGSFSWPCVSACWISSGETWKLFGSKDRASDSHAEPEAERLFKEICRTALRALAASRTPETRAISNTLQEPWTVWLDFMRREKRGFRQIRKARRWTDFRRIMEAKEPIDTSNLPLIEDGTIMDLFAESASFCEDLAAREIKCTGIQSAADDPSDRRARVEAFILKCESETGAKVSRTHIWRAAGHSVPRQFQFWQANNPKATTQDDQNFERLLAMPPGDFVTLLKKKGILS